LCPDVQTGGTPMTATFIHGKVQSLALRNALIVENFKFCIFFLYKFILKPFRTELNLKKVNFY